LGARNLNTAAAPIQSAAWRC